MRMRIKDGSAGAEDDDTVARCANRGHALIGGRLFLPPPLPPAPAPIRTPRGPSPPVPTATGTIPILGPKHRQSHPKQFS